MLSIYEGLKLQYSIYNMNSTQELTHFIQTNIPCIFVKYGDGEYYAATFMDGGNCDGTPYTKNLGNKLRESFVYNSQQKNVMMGEWHNKNNKSFWQGLTEGWPVQWVDFHTVLIDGSTTSPDKMYLFKAIQESPLKKIYVANDTMGRAKALFNIQEHVVINPSNWFDTEYDSVFNQVSAAVEDDSNTMILISAGMGGKYLISELHKKYPNAIYIDIGSGFDMICAKRNSRSYNPSYDTLCNYLAPMLPSGWD